MTTTTIVQFRAGSKSIQKQYQRMYANDCELVANSLKDAQQLFDRFRDITGFLLRNRQSGENLSNAATQS